MRMAKVNVTVVVGLLLAGALLSGCASPRLRTGYLENYDRLTAGRYIDGIWVDREDMGGRMGVAIRLDKIDTGRIADQDGVKAGDCRQWLKDALTVAAAPVRDSLIIASDDGSEPAAPMKLEMAVTEMTPGSVAARFWAAEFGAGHAWVQVEGKVLDAESGKEIVTFTDRRRASGAAGFRDMGGDSGPALVRELLQEIAVNIVAELRNDLPLRQ